MTDSIDVFPKKNGGWYWKKGTSTSKKFNSRDEAFQDALVERDVEPILLLRENGKVYGELYHEMREGGNPQRVDLLAASERNGTSDIGG